MGNFTLITQEWSLERGEYVDEQHHTIEWIKMLLEELPWDDEEFCDSTTAALAHLYAAEEFDPPDEEEIIVTYLTLFE